MNGGVYRLSVFDHFRRKRMNRLKSVFSFYVVFGLLLTGFLTTAANAQLYRNEREIRDIIRTLNSKIDDFRMNVSSELRRSAVSGADRQDLEDQLRLFEFEMRDFEVDFERQGETADDVAAVLKEAKKADDIIKRMSLSQRTLGYWTDVRYQLDRLAANYNVSWDWNTGRARSTGGSSRYPSGNNRRSGNSPPVLNRNTTDPALTGTYRLDPSRSEDPREIAERAIDNNSIESDAERRDLEEKLDAPEQLAIEIRGNQVTIASSKSGPVSLTVNGQDQTENINGRTVRMRATMRGGELVLASLGGETDYTITFASIDGGQGLKVTRRITTPYLNQTVFADSIYEKTDEIARLGIDTGDYSDDDDTGYSSNDPDDYPNSNYPTSNPPTTYPRTGEYIVPNGMILMASLNNEINTKASQNNDRFTMTVQSPNEFRGAVIEGHLTGIDRSGKVSGRSQVTFNFDRIRLKNGQVYDFAGFLQNITDHNGKTVKVGSEGEVKSDSQTRETVKRGGIGAGIGAIIGAIAGGAKGAAIGAIIGAGGGAGSVILTGKEDLVLKQGSTITVQASSPIR
jgi:hypothetical protein